ncbi:hypothetical protein GCM10011583_07580 [Streptomyces camponoticapitis]|uniref:DUF3618 domain-containing protein n=1 Tax=Streptomyces camponoticapitis TaxID=1616125 RepID=A0ABQ2DZ10_9ACTN|nr:DUF3618 domain-containing protein [Streptomyces camponoticapitis]GGJ78514.1 hypothetical protein GCM10011583_07580 [Streptomyces camponoticapitis]
MSKNSHGPEGSDDNTVAGARHRVEEARERLGDSVGQLAAKADVKGRTQEKAAEVRDQVVEVGQQVRDQIKEHTPERVRDAATRAAVTGKEVATKAAGTGRANPRPLLVAGGVAVVVLAVARARRRSRRS